MGRVGARSAACVDTEFPLLLLADTTTETAQICAMSARMLIFFACSAISGFGGYLGSVLLYTAGFECLNSVTLGDPNCAAGLFLVAVGVAVFFAKPVTVETITNIRRRMGRAE
jgi:hypothetical protein